MKQRTGRKKHILWIVSGCLTASLIFLAVRIALYGIPLAGLPRAEQIDYATLAVNGSESGMESAVQFEAVKLCDEEELDRLVRAAWLLAWQPLGECDEIPFLVLTYHLKDGTEQVVQATETTVWWHGRARRLRQEDVFVNVVKNLYLTPGGN